MAVLTKAEIAERVLEALGVKAAGQAASAEDTLAAQEAVSSAWARLRYDGKAPFGIDTVPEWAWTPMRDYVARDLINVFGLTGERLAAVMSAGNKAERDFAAQSAGKHDPQRKTMPYYF